MRPCPRAQHFDPSEVQGLTPGCLGRRGWPAPRKDSWWLYSAIARSQYALFRRSPCGAATALLRDSASRESSDKPLAARLIHVFSFTESNSLIADTTASSALSTASCSGVCGPRGCFDLLISPCLHASGCPTNPRLCLKITHLGRLYLGSPFSSTPSTPANASKTSATLDERKGSNVPRAYRLAVSTRV